MMTVVKGLITLVAVVIVVALLAPMALQGKIQEIVKREANNMLQAKLDFEKLNISLLRHFPNASLELKGLTLVGVDRFEGDTIVSANRISVVVNPLSLFSESGFEVKKVLLHAPSVHGHKLADGAVNWDIMKPSEEPEEVAETTASEEAAAPSSFRLAVRDFRISEAVIRYEDDSTRMAFSTEPLDLRLRGDLSAATSELDLRLAMQRLNFRSGVVQMLSDAEVELKAKIAADLEKMSFRFSKNTLRLNAITLSLDGWAELLDEGAIAMDIKAGTEGVQFKEVLSLIPAFYTREFRSLTAGGELSLSLWARGEMRGAQLPAFELKTAVKNGRFQYASLPKAVTDINLSARVANPGGV
ncbi:MAG: AsmA family protein, partial [Alistipes sp.]|nr:AsmA family protein [Alistipes sp.]